MEDIIKRLKDKTFTVEDIEMLYEYFKDSKNKEITEEIVKFKQYIRTVMQCKKKCNLLFVSCKSLHDFLNYYYIAQNNIPNILGITAENRYEYNQALSTILKSINEI